MSLFQALVGMRAALLVKEFLKIAVRQQIHGDELTGLPCRSGWWSVCSSWGKFLMSR
jgi:hypothetical protein